MTQRPFDPLRKLAKLSEEVGKQLGLKLMQFAAMPGPEEDGSGDMINMIFVFDDEAGGSDKVELSAEEKALFADMESQLREQSKDEKIEQAKQDLLGTLKRPEDGIL